ncbi:hypothetical protein FRC04_010760 [Tulasnella sp. 424]|nr:hypothetical protein FRC04_010760 [Tulasnella sp. 424]KAG8969286.1 hypothetical protein FRC05_001146 [Tulasnella sp. 425]
MDSKNHPANILNLPPEITVSILQYLLANPDPNKSPYHGLLPVTQSSTHLRQTAMSAPSLWSVIEINDKPASFNFAKLCVSRSGHHKLDISIMVLKKMEAKINGLIALLQYVSSRIRNLSMKLSFTGPGQWDLWWDSLKVLDYRALEDLNFSVWRREVWTLGAVALSDAIPLPTQTSLLRSLSLVNASLQLPDFLVLSNLAVLKLSSASFWGWPYTNLFEVLRSSTGLEELELRGLGLEVCQGHYSAGELPSVPRLEHPKLRQLTLIGVENNMVAQILTNLTAPKLEAVSLEAPKELENDVCFVWNDLRQVAPFSTVRYLFVTDHPTPIPPFLEQFALFLAKLFPGVEELELPASWYRAFLSTWAEQGHIAVNPWRDLRSVVLNYSDNVCDGSSHDLVNETLRFLEARRKLDCPPLEWLHLGVCRSCQLLFKEVRLSGIQKLMRSKDDLEVIQLSH